MFVVLRSMNNSGLWCNGSTTDFGSVCLGSNPDGPTIADFFKNNFSSGSGNDFIYTNQVIQNAADFFKISSQKVYYILIEK